MSSLIEALLAGEVNDLAEVGGENAIWAATDELGESPALPLAVELVARAWPVADTTAARRLVDVGLDGEHSPLAFADTIDAVLDINGEFAAALTPIVRRRCRARLDRRDGSFNAYFAGVAVETLIRLGISGDDASRFAAQAALSDISLGDDPSYREIAARCCGVAYEHWREPAIRSVLTMLADDDIEGGEASQQLGLAELVDAFEGAIADADGHVEMAKRWFQRAAADDDRTDAQVYAAVSAALEAFLYHDGDALASSVQDLGDAMLVRQLWQPAGGRYRWLAPRRSAEIEWATLLSALDVAAAQLSSAQWLVNAGAVLGAAANAYKASRAVHIPGIAADRIPNVVEPHIAAAMVRREALIEFVEQALADPLTLGISAELLGSLRERMRVASGDPPGKASGGDRWPTLATVAEVIATGTASPELDAVIDGFELRARDRVAATEPLDDPIIDNLLDQLDSTLDTSIAFPARARNALLMVLALTLRFARDRMDVSIHTAGDRVAYLRRYGSDDPAPLEADMMKDFREFLAGSPVGSRLSIELWDVAGGRVDLVVTFDAWRVVVEGKRSFEMVTHDVARALVVGQAAVYQKSNMPVTVALVLDLSDKSGAVGRHLVDSTWTDTIREGGIDRQVVVVVLPGRLINPSAVKLPRSQ